MILARTFKNRVFVKLYSRYSDYFSDHSNYSGRDLLLSKYMYGMNNYGNLFSDGLTEWLIEAGYIQYQF